MVSAPNNDKQAGEVVGHVVAHYRYPVKSMRGEAIQQARAWLHGLEGDRRYAFVREHDRSGFPWLTGRQVPQMLRYVPFFVAPDDPLRSPVCVRTPDGRELEVESAELLAELAEQADGGIYLMHLGRGTMDGAPLSLISTGTVRAIGEAAGREIEPRRFRMNVIVETTRGVPAEEDGWLGSTLVFGDRADSLRVDAKERDERCMMINLDPDMAVQQPTVLRAVVQTRESCAGIYTWPTTSGTIQVGDAVRRLPVAL
jgi:uncharacterized protein YcbX